MSKSDMAQMYLRRGVFILFMSLFAIVVTHCTQKEEPSSTPSLPQDERLAPSEDLSVEILEVEETDATSSHNENELVGTWKVLDSEGDSLDIVIFPDGTAITNWTKGEAGARGEAGEWVDHGEEGIILTYDSGWKDVLLEEEGSHIKLGYAPGITLNDQPSNESPAERLTAPSTPYIGVWQLPSSERNSPEFIAIKSDGVAQQSKDNLKGTWTLEKEGVLVKWEDGSSMLIAQNPDQTFIYRAWDADVERTHPPTTIAPLSMPHQGIKKAPPLPQESSLNPEKAEDVQFDLSPVQN